MLEENLENTFASNPYHQMGGYVKPSLGVKMYIKIENPKGTRFPQLVIAGQEVEKEKTYQAAFVTVQGVPKKYGTNRHNLSVHVIDALKQYIEKVGIVESRLRETCEVV